MAQPFPSCSQRPAAAAAMSPSVRQWLASSQRHQPLAERTVLELARRIQRWQQHPDGPRQAPEPVRRRALRARDQLVRHNLRLIGHTWGRHRSGLPAADDTTADAFQEAAISLLRAAEKFDPARGYRFSTYASFWVRRGFSEHDRRNRRMVHLPHDKAALVLRAQRLANDHQARCGQLPSITWLAQRCGPRGSAVDPDRLAALLLLWWRTAPLELDRPAPGADGEALGQTLLERLAAPQRQSEPVGEWPEDPRLAPAAEDDGPAGMEPWEQAWAALAGDPHDPQRALLPRLVQHLSPEQRRLLWHRHLREHPLNSRQIQKAMGLTPAEQQRLEQQALELLRRMARQVGAV